MAAGKKWQYRTRMETGPDVWVTSQNGVLQCSVRQHEGVGIRHWCDHIRSCIEGEDDATWCFDPGALIVPMFPTSDMYAEVRIDDKVTAGGRRLLIPVQDGGNYSPDQDFVGFISPGEGRKVIRSMLLNWAEAKVRRPGDPDGAECRSSMHGVTAENRLKQMYQNAQSKQSRNMQAINTWSVADVGVCVMCAATASSPDLVPDL